MVLLFDSAPGFDQPLAVLKHCHDRIRKQLNTLEKLVQHLPLHGADENARHATEAVLRYFTQAAPLHHEDEEIDLLPMLQDTARDGDARALAQLLPAILTQHEQMTSSWARLEVQLKAIANGVSSSLAAADVVPFNALYAEHMRIEETQIATMAKRIFSEAQIQALGLAMQKRRGL